MMLAIPDEVASVLRGFPSSDVNAQAFPFLTVDDRGYPHAALLSRSEIEPGMDGNTLLAAVASRRTRQNLLRSGAAGLMVVNATACHHIKLRMIASVVDGDILGCAFTLVEHKRDDIGIPLSPLSFRTSAELSVLEDWPRSTAIIARLQALLEGGQET
jgi:hypothetical protein